MATDSCIEYSILKPSHLLATIRDVSSSRIFEAWQTLAGDDRGVADNDGETAGVGAALVGLTGVLAMGLVTEQHHGQHHWPQHGGPKKERS